MEKIKVLIKDIIVLFIKLTIIYACYFIRIKELLIIKYSVAYIPICFLMLSIIVFDIPRLAYDVSISIFCTKEGFQFRQKLKNHIVFGIFNYSIPVFILISCVVNLIADKENGASNLEFVLVRIWMGIMILILIIPIIWGFSNFMKMNKQIKDRNTFKIVGKLLKSHEYNRGFSYYCIVATTRKSEDNIFLPYRNYIKNNKDIAVGDEVIFEVIKLKNNSNPHLINIH